MVESDFRGRRLSSRVLRGGAFNNQTSNVRSANRNNNQPDNRNNNNGFRPASTLRQACGLPCRNSLAAFGRPAGCASAEFRSSSRVRPVLSGQAKSKNWRGGSGRPAGFEGPAASAFCAPRVPDFRLMDGEREEKRDCDRRVFWKCSSEGRRFGLESILQRPMN